MIFLILNNSAIKVTESVKKICKIFILQRELNWRSCAQTRKERENKNVFSWKKKRRDVSGFVLKDKLGQSMALWVKGFSSLSVRRTQTWFVSYSQFIYLFFLSELNAGQIYKRPLKHMIDSRSFRVDVNLQTSHNLFKYNDKKIKQYI